MCAHDMSGFALHRCGGIRHYRGPVPVSTSDGSSGNTFSRRAMSPVGRVVDGELHRAVRRDGDVLAVGADERPGSGRVAEVGEPDSAAGTPNGRVLGGRGEV